MHRAVKVGEREREVDARHVQIAADSPRQPRRRRAGTAAPRGRPCDAQCVRVPSLRRCRASTNGDVQRCDRRTQRGRRTNRDRSRDRPSAPRSAGANACGLVGPIRFATLRATGRLTPRRRRRSSSVPHGLPAPAASATTAAAPATGEAAAAAATSDGGRERGRGRARRSRWRRIRWCRCCRAG